MGTDNSEIERLRRTPYYANDNVRKAGLFSVDTGLRRGDILGLRWENFDFSAPRKPLLVLRMHKTGLGNTDTVVQELLDFGA